MLSSTTMRRKPGSWPLSSARTMSRLARPSRSDQKRATGTTGMTCSPRSVAGAAALVGTTGPEEAGLQGRLAGSGRTGGRRVHRARGPPSDPGSPPPARPWPRGYGAGWSAPPAGGPPRRAAPPAGRAARARHHPRRHPGRRPRIRAGRAGRGRPEAPPVASTRGRLGGCRWEHRSSRRGASPRVRRRQEDRACVSGTGGPDRIRTGDLQRDRLACWAATPRVPRSGERAGVRRITPGSRVAYPPAPMPDLIDLRSDTVTHPTPEMRRAMAEAEVGDDVFGDDPTVIALEERAAELTGKEAGLFVASGTMGNLVTHMAHVPRGGEIIAEPPNPTSSSTRPRGHAVVVGAIAWPVPARRRRHDGPRRHPRRVPRPRRPARAHHGAGHAREHARASMGQPLTAAYTSAVAAVAHEHGVPLHVDGARLFNAVGGPGHPGARAARRTPTRPPSASPRAWPARSAPSWSAARTSSGARGEPASWSAAACARWACWQRPGSSRCATGRRA